MKLFNLSCLFSISLFSFELYSESFTVVSWSLTKSFTQEMSQTEKQTEKLARLKKIGELLRSKGPLYNKDIICFQGFDTTLRGIGTSIKPLLNSLGYDVFDGPQESKNPLQKNIFKALEEITGKDIKEAINEMTDEDIQASIPSTKEIKALIKNINIQEQIQSLDIKKIRSLIVKDQNKKIIKALYEKNPDKDESEEVIKALSEQNLQSIKKILASGSQQIQAELKKVDPEELIAAINITELIRNMPEQSIEKLTKIDNFKKSAELVQELGPHLIDYIDIQKIIALIDFKTIKNLFSPNNALAQIGVFPSIALKACKETLMAFFKKLGNKILNTSQAPQQPVRTSSPTPPNRIKTTKKMEQTTYTNGSCIAFKKKRFRLTGKNSFALPDKKTLITHIQLTSKNNPNHFKIALISSQIPKEYKHSTILVDKIGFTVPTIICGNINKRNLNFKSISWKNCANNHQSNSIFYTPLIPQVPFELICSNYQENTTDLSDNPIIESKFDLTLSAEQVQKLKEQKAVKDFAHALHTISNKKNQSQSLYKKPFITRANRLSHMQKTLFSLNETI